jgi:hypothetical protein
MLDALKNNWEIIVAVIGFLGFAYGAYQKVRQTWKKKGVVAAMQEALDLLTDYTSHKLSKLPEKEKANEIKQLKEAQEMTGTREIIKESYKSPAKGPTIEFGGDVKPGDIKDSRLNVKFRWPW